LGSLPIRWASPCLQRIQFLLSLSISAPDKFEVYFTFTFVFLKLIEVICVLFRVSPSKTPVRPRSPRPPLH
jgi:hypothetical protein